VPTVCRAVHSFPGTATSAQPRCGSSAPAALLRSAASAQAEHLGPDDLKRIDPATSQRKRFSSVILPPWCRKTPKVAEVLPLLYLPDLSGGDFVPALEQFLGTSAGLSAATVTRLTAQRQDDYKTFGRRELSQAEQAAGG
jgi:hypothetical protein